MDLPCTYIYDYSRKINLSWNRSFSRDLLLSLCTRKLTMLVCKSGQNQAQRFLKRSIRKKSYGIHQQFGENNITVWAAGQWELEFNDFIVARGGRDGVEGVLLARGGQPREEEEEERGSFFVVVCEKRERDLISTQGVLRCHGEKPTIQTLNCPETEKRELINRQQGIGRTQRREAGRQAAGLRNLFRGP